jgi:hypothetical protein
MSARSVASADEHVAATARHESGHALARLYFGHSLQRVVVRPMEDWNKPYIDRRGRTIEGLAGIVEAYGICDTLTEMSLRELRRDLLRKQVQPIRINAEIALIECLAGPVAGAYHLDGWPEEDAPFIEYDMLWINGGDGDQEHADSILAALSEGERRRRRILQVAGERTEALVGSRPGWRFIEALAARLCNQWVVEEEECEALFAAAFGTPKPRFGAWHRHWAPSTDMMRSGRLPAA